nr:hypothetical protein [Tanacetum cinerariifolium]
MEFGVVYVYHGDEVVKYQTNGDFSSGSFSYYNFDLRTTITEKEYLLRIHTLEVSRIVSQRTEIEIVRRLLTISQSGNGRIDGQDGQVGGQGSEADQGRGQGNGRNQIGDAVDDNIQVLASLLLHHEEGERLDEPVEVVVGLEVNGRIDGQDGQVGGQGSEADQGRGQGNGRNQIGDAVDDNIQGDFSRGCTYKEFLACNPKEDSQKVKYTDGLFFGKALTWWNSQIHTRGREAAVGMSWEDFKTLTREKFYPSNEMQKLETELWNHAMVEVGHAAYTDKFHELARLVLYLVTLEGKRIKRAPCRTCFNCNRPGHFSKDYRVAPRNVNLINAINLVARTCYECGSTDHIKSACLRLNQAQRPGERGRAFMLGAEEARQDPNIMTGFSYEIEIASRKLKEIDKVITGCKLEIEGHVFDINLIPFGSRSFDVIMGMDWLSDQKAEIICHEKVVRIPLLDGAMPVAKSPYRLAPSELKELLGLVGYYSKFIKDFSKISKPLTVLIQKTLRDGPKNFVVYCDACGLGLGCVLMQRGKVNVVADALSRKSGMIAGIKVEEEIIRNLERLDIKLYVRGQHGYWASLRDEPDLISRIKEAQKEDSEI